MNSVFPKFLSLITFLIFIYLTSALAQKADLKNKNLEFDNLRNFRGYAGVYEKKSGRQSIFKPDYGPGEGSAENIARAYLHEYKTYLGIDNISTEVRLKSNLISPGGRHVIFNETINGYPVYHSEIVVTINKYNIVTFVANKFRSVQNLIDDIPSISKNEAIEVALSYLGAGEELFDAPDSELMVFETKNSGPVLSYRTTISTSMPRGDWEVFVNARDGNIIHVKNHLMHKKAAEGVGLIWDPDPLSSAQVFYGGDFSDPGGEDFDRESLNSQRTEVMLRDLTFEAGTYKLEGPYVKLVDIEAPLDTFPQLSDSSNFNFKRSEQEFEDVMVYFHIDEAARWLRSLGFIIDGTNEFKADPHGYNGEDNSYYSPFGNFCAFGEGGVDDAEDAAVIWHEYAHAIQQNITGGMIYEDETLSLQEGSADYWAASYSRARSGFAWGQVFIWDAGNTSELDDEGTFWPGRRCDLDWQYPEHYVAGHEGGQIWSSALMNIWSELGREITDKLFIQAHYIWGTSPDLQDAAEAFIEADWLLYEGSHLTTLVNWFDYHGLIRAEEFLPTIQHIPYPDTENFTGPYVIDAEIIPASSQLDTTNLWLIWGTQGEFSDSLLLKLSEIPNHYVAQIPGSGTESYINYYLSIQDSIGNIVTNPKNAPEQYHSFFVGLDSISPVVVHNPILDQPLIRWPANIEALITDNLGIDSVLVEYFVNDTVISDSFLLQPTTENDLYVGVFNLDTNQVNLNDSISYRIIAVDASARANKSFSPEVGYFKFCITDGGGSFVYGFEFDDGNFNGDNDWEWGIPQGGPQDAYEGSNLWATKLNHDYSAGPLLSSLIMPEINLLGFNDVTLEFWHWYNIEPTYDGGNLKLSTNSGKTWEVIYPLAGYDGPIDTRFSNPLAGEQAYTGSSGGWLRAQYDLNPYRGNVILLKFEFGADISEVSEGWFVDLVSIKDQKISLMAPQNLVVLDSVNSVALNWKFINKNLQQNLQKNEKLGARGVLSQSINHSTKAAPPFTISFNVYRSPASQDFALLHNTTETNYVDTTVSVGEQYCYYVTAQYESVESGPSDTICVTVEAITGIDAAPQRPKMFLLAQNYPNPFNPLTTIHYQLPKSETVKIEIFNVVGQRVIRLVKEYQSPGYYSVIWDGRSEDGREIASGVYIYRMQAGTFVKQKKMLYLK